MTACMHFILSTIKTTTNALDNYQSTINSLVSLSITRSEQSNQLDHKVDLSWVKVCGGGGGVCVCACDGVCVSKCVSVCMWVCEGVCVCEWLLCVSGWCV